MSSPSPPVLPGQTWSGLGSVDWLILVLLVWSVTMGFVRGFIREIASLAGTVLGLVLATWNYPWVAQYLRPWLHTEPLLDAIAFLLIVSVVLVACSLLGRVLRSGAHALGLGLLDRTTGAALGLARGLLVAVAIMAVITAFLPPQPAVAKSRVVPYLLAATHGVCFVVPQQMQRQIAAGAADLMHSKARWIKPRPASDDEGTGRDQNTK